MDIKAQSVSEQYLSNPKPSQVGRILQVEVDEQFEAGLKMTALSWRETKAQIRAANPGATKEQIDLLYVQERYGEETAQQFAAGLEQRRLNNEAQQNP